MKKAKIAHCTPHDLRRSFSTIAQRAGVDKYTVKDLGGGSVVSVKDLGGWPVVSVVEEHCTGEVMEVHRRAMVRTAGSA